MNKFCFEKKCMDVNINQLHLSMNVCDSYPWNIKIAFTQEGM